MPCQPLASLRLLNHFLSSQVLETMNNLLEKAKSMGKVVADSGAKTMLKTDIVFLEREVKTRKQKFGVEVYDLMAQLEVDDGTSVEEKESKIRLAFDTARKDINVIQAKIDGKREEMAKTEVVDAFASGTSGAPGVEIPADHQPAAATIVTD